MYIVCPSVLSYSNLKLHQTFEAKNIFKREKIMLNVNRLSNNAALRTFFLHLQTFASQDGLTLAVIATSQAPHAPHG